jgi:multidrug transporter EmrE-like cation transporter
MTVTVALIILVASVFYGFGEYYSKIYANTASIKALLTSLGFYNLTSLCFFPAIKRMNSLSVLGTIWNVAYMIVTIFLGVVVFGEVLTTLQIIGIILGIAAIICLSI